MTNDNSLKEVIQAYEETISSNRSNKQRVYNAARESYNLAKSHMCFALYAVEWCLKQYMTLMAYGYCYRDLCYTSSDEELSAIMCHVNSQKLWTLEFLVTLDNGFGYSAINGLKDLTAYKPSYVSDEMAHEALKEIEFLISEFKRIWTKYNCKEKECIKSWQELNSR